MTENIVTGRSYRILTDKANEVYDRISFWTHATDVEMANGNNLQDELSNTIDTINGTITNQVSALETQLNSTITSRLSPLEQQVTTNKNGITALNTNLTTLQTTVSNNYGTLMSEINKKLTAEWKQLTTGQIASAYGKFTAYTSPDMTDLYVEVQLTNPYSETAVGYLTRYSDSCRFILLGQFAGTYDTYKVGCYWENDVLHVNAPKQAIRANAGEYTPDPTFPVEVTVYYR